MNNLDPIYVTRPFIPPLEDYQAMLAEVWESRTLTNNGAMTQRLEGALATVLGCHDFVAINNGTTAIQLGIKALALSGEIITTPFTWIATVGAIKAEGCTPRFCDINPKTLNIDVDSIESLITEDTVAIMPVHVFGNPCDVERIQSIADRHNLRVVYDAAHALGATINGSSVLNCGDVSAVSLHATKLLNTGEGGGCISTDAVTNQKIRCARNFGLNEEAIVVQDGVNGKLSEIQAALGLAGLPYLDDILADRRAKYEHYLKKLSGLSALSFQKLNGDGSNRMYFPLILPTEAILLTVCDALNKQKVYPRRYFYPSLTQYEASATGDATPIADDIANRVLCLPLYFDLPLGDIDRICSIIRGVVTE